MMLLFLVSLGIKDDLVAQLLHAHVNSGLILSTCYVSDRFSVPFSKPRK